MPGGIIGTGVRMEIQTLLPLALPSPQCEVCLMTGLITGNEAMQRRRPSMGHDRYNPPSHSIVSGGSYGRGGE